MYLLLVAVHVRQSKVVLLQEIEVFTHSEEQELTFSPLLFGQKVKGTPVES